MTETLYAFCARHHAQATGRVLREWPVEAADYAAASAAVVVDGATSVRLDAEQARRLCVGIDLSIEIESGSSYEPLSGNRAHAGMSGSYLGHDGKRHPCEGSDHTGSLSNARGNLIADAHICWCEMRWPELAAPRTA